MSAEFFSEADRLRLFTRVELQERLGDVCTVEWFLQEFRIPTRCKGRVIAGADLVQALGAPPPAASEQEPQKPASAVRAPRKPKPKRESETCAGIEFLQPGRGRA